MEEDWERAATENGIPYYINHKTEQTFWNHPVIMKLEKNLVSLGKIKYAAYRTAMKLRAIQKATSSCSLQLSTIKEFFEVNSVSESLDLKETVTAAELRAILKDLFIHEVKSGGRMSSDPLLASELMLNWLLNVHDNSRKGQMRFLSVRITLVVICSGLPREKYNYLYSQIQTREGTIDKDRLGFFLQACLKIPKYLNEQKAFGAASIEPAIKNFFEQASYPDQGFSSDFVNWMLAEPQPLVWIPTMYRMAASETVKHEAKCNVCKMFPLVGFRYKCLQCFNFDICQECFWTGRTSKSHKLSHPTQEYCMPSSQTRDLKDTKKMFKNKLFKSKKKKEKQSSKKRYTEVPPDQQSVKSGEPDFEGMDDSGNVEENYSEPSNYQTTSEYAEETSITLQNNEPVEEMNEENTWDPDIQPLERPRSMESVRHEGMISETESNHEERDNIQETIEESTFRADQKLELEKILESLDKDNRDFQNQIETIRDNQQQEIQNKTMLADENVNLRMEKRRMNERQAVLEEHNRLLEIEMQKLRLLLQQQKEDMLTMIEIKELAKSKPSRSKFSLHLPKKGKPNASTHTNNASYQTQGFGPPRDSTLHIPTALAVKNSRILPIYESIPKVSLPLRPAPRRVAWSSEADARVYSYIDHTRDSNYEGDTRRESDMQRNPMIEQVMVSRRRHLGLNRSAEEQVLDQTVQWAMENFGFSETDSNC